MTATTSERGLFLVLEGVEGAGKSTQLARLSRRLEARGVPHAVVREPGGTPAGERIREIVLDGELELAAETELLLMLAARAEFVRARVEPALARGELVLADRYELSTFAYQGVARDLGLPLVRKLNAFATGGRKPDAVLLLEIEEEESRRRSGSPGDRMEGAGAAFHEAVARAYRELGESEDEVIVVDGSGSPDRVEDRVWDELASRWPDVFEAS